MKMIEGGVDDVADAMFLLWSQEFSDYPLKRDMEWVKAELRYQCRFRPPALVAKAIRVTRGFVGDHPIRPYFYGVMAGLSHG